MLAMFAGGANTVKAQQVEFQALKKASGNTFTARSMPLNYFAVFSIMGIGGFIIARNCYLLANGTGKVVMEKDK